MPGVPPLVCDEALVFPEGLAALPALVWILPSGHTLVDGDMRLPSELLPTCGVGEGLFPAVGLLLLLQGRATAESLAAVPAIGGHLLRAEFGGRTEA